MKEIDINKEIAAEGIDTNMISDGYHTFGELYDHRIALFIALMKLLAYQPEVNYVWRSKKHSDGSEWSGWFILGYDTRVGKQITYHLPDSDWDKCDFANTRDMAPEWDGHTSADVLSRLKLLVAS